LEGDPGEMSGRSLGECGATIKEAARVRIVANKVRALLAGKIEQPRVLGRTP